MTSMPKFLVNINAPGVGPTSYRVEAPNSDNAIDQAVQEYVRGGRGMRRHQAKIREEALASAEITAVKEKK